MHESHVKNGIEYSTTMNDVDRRELTVNIVELTSHVSIGVFVDDVGFQLSPNGAEQLMEGLKKVLDYWEMRKKDGI